MKGACGTRLGSDEALLPFPDLPEATKQPAGDIHDDSAVAGIDPHQDSYTVGIVDANGVELTHETFPTTAAGYLDGMELLNTHGVAQVGIEGSAGWGAHAAMAFVAAGLDCREVPAQRSAAQRRARRLDKTDAVDAVAAARALLAEPTLGPVQTVGGV